MGKGKSLTFSSFTRILILVVGLFWCVLGVIVAASDKIAPKMLNWNYVFAWILLFGFPFAALIWLSFHKPYTNKPKPSATQKSSSEENYQKPKNVVGQGYNEPVKEKKSVNMVYVGNVQFIPTIKLDSKEPKSPLAYTSQAALSETKFCRHCNAIISRSEYESYEGLCRGCYMDFKREIRRSGLFGADRANTW